MASNTTLSIIVAIIVMLLVIGVLSFAFAGLGGQTRETGEGLFTFIEDFKEIFRIGSPMISLEELELKTFTSERITVGATIRNAKGYIIKHEINGVEQPIESLQDDEDSSRTFTLPNDIQIPVPQEFTGSIDFTLIAEKDRTERRQLLTRRTFNYLKPSLPGVENWLGLGNYQSVDDVITIPVSIFYERNREFFQKIDELCTIAENFCCQGTSCNAIIAPCDTSAAGGHNNNHIYIYAFANRDIPGVGCSLNDERTDGEGTNYRYSYCSQEFFNTLKNNIQSCNQRNDVEYSQGLYVKW